MTKAATQFRDTNGKNGQEKKTERYFTVIFRAILLKQVIEKE